jgi:hypothetical protein
MSEHIDKLKLIGQQIEHRREDRMPKDPTENIGRYKIRGGHLNEYEFHENQEALVEQQTRDTQSLIPGTPPQVRAKQLQQLTKLVAASVKKKPTKQNSVGKKIAAKKSAATKTSAKKTAAKKTGAKKKTKK